MISRETRLQYIPYGLVVVGLFAVWYGYFDRQTFLVIGATAILGAAFAVLRGYTAPSLAVMFGGISLSAVLSFVIHLVAEGISQPIWLGAYLLLSIAGSFRARQYWRAHPETPENSAG